MHVYQTRVSQLFTYYSLLYFTHAQTEADLLRPTINPIMRPTMFSALLLSPAALLVTADNVDCEYSSCQQALTASDCQEIATQCQAYGGISSCAVGEFEFECNDIALSSSSTCTSDASAATICNTYSYSSIATCALTEGDCDLAPVVTSAPTPAGGYAITRIDCSYDSCSQILTDTDCTSLSAQCTQSGGVSFCVPGDNEFECNNIPYSGTGACTDATATTQCESYVYGGGYSCTDREGECDDPVTMTLAPTPAAAEVQQIDCSYDDCTTVLTADDCAAIASTCSAAGGVSFCVPGENEFECNNIVWNGAGGCTDTAASTQCLDYTFAGLTCTDKDGDCNSLSSASEDDSDISDSELVAIAFMVPLVVVALGGLIWYVRSKKADKPRMSTAPPSDLQMHVEVIIGVRS